MSRNTKSGCVYFVASEMRTCSQPCRGQYCDHHKRATVPGGLATTQAIEKMVLRGMDSVGTRIDSAKRATQQHAKFKKADEKQRAAKRQNLLSAPK